MSENKNNHATRVGENPKDKGGKPSYWRTRDTEDPSANVSAESCLKLANDPFPKGSFTITMTNGSSMRCSLKSFSGKSLLIFAMPGPSLGVSNQRLSNDAIPKWREIPSAAGCSAKLNEIRESGLVKTASALDLQVVILTTQQPEAHGELLNQNDDIWFASDPSCGLTEQLPNEFAPFRFNGKAFHRRFAMFVENGFIKKAFGSEESVDKIVDSVCKLQTKA